MHRGLKVVLLAGLAALLVAAWSLPAAAAQQQRRAIQMGPYFQTLKADASIDASIDRGKQLFNQLGCGGCHPRGGTIGGVQRNVAGDVVPIPVPDLRGAALHYPRLSMTGFAANIGIMNDL